MGGGDTCHAACNKNKLIRPRFIAAVLGNAGKVSTCQLPHMEKKAKTTAKGDSHLCGGGGEGLKPMPMTTK
jgi:hypothetical protein